MSYQHALLLCIPFISAAIGWVTNYVAIKMLFRPERPVNFYLFRLQGIFPKRKQQLAERLGRVVSKDLLSTEAIAQRVDNTENKDKVRAAIISELDSYLRETLPARNQMLKWVLTDSRINQILEHVQEQLDAMIPRLMGQFVDKVRDIDLKQIVTDKVSRFSNEKLEQLLMGVIRKELKFIEGAGAVLGFFIGVIQSLLMWATL